MVLLLLPGLAARPDEAAAAPLRDRQQQFLDGVRTSSELARVTGRPALDPLRVAVPVDAGDARARADRAGRELVDGGGLDRAVLLVVLPTGSGWVNPAAADAVEALAGGDVATVTVQYDDRPSYQSFLSGGGDRAAPSRPRPPGRPRRRAGGDVRSRRGWCCTARASARWADCRRPTTRWSTDRCASGVPQAARHLVEAVAGRGRVHVVEHDDDPVPAWSPWLLLAPTAGWNRGWAPVVSFWGATGDLLGSLDQPPGHGHRYGPELVPALADATAAEVTPRVLRADAARRRRRPVTCCATPVTAWTERARWSSSRWPPSVRSRSWCARCWWAGSRGGRAGPPSSARCLVVLTLLAGAPRLATVAGVVVLLVGLVLQLAWSYRRGRYLEDDVAGLWRRLRGRPPSPPGAGTGPADD